MIIRPVKLSQEEKQETVRRLWQKDPSLWSMSEHDYPAIVERLGWLDITHRVRERLDEIRSFGLFIKDSEFCRVCLLGMGGSSLFALVLSKVFGPSKGYPDLLVLDTTDPEEVEKVEDLDMEKTFFLVCSKSGTTIEVQALFNFFWEKVSQVSSRPGKQFAAITDPGSPLEETAREKGFERCF